MTDMLSLTEDLPVVEFSAGNIIVKEGDESGCLWILERGTLEVRKGEVVVNTISRPGAVIGEISMLLQTSYSATVLATDPATLRYVENGEAFVADKPEVVRLVAQALAERLSFATAYLADIKHQYGDAPGLAMVSEVLNELAQRQAPVVQSGSARDPDPDY